MPMPTAQKRQPVFIAAGGHTFKFTTEGLAGFPEAKAFLAHLLTTGKLQSHISATYVKLAARLKRQGRLGDIDHLTHRNERTAANAYVKWQLETYDARLAPVRRALARHLNKRETLRHVRVHSLVPPIAGKQIPRVMPTGVTDLDSVRHLIGQPAPATVLKANVVMVASTTWTLHVPEKACAPHQDPCADCLAIELSAEELEVIASAFEKAWGHRELAKVPQDAYMFGEPPPESTTNGSKPHGEKIAALIGPGVTADELVRANARVAQDVDSFLARLHEGAEGVYVSRAACGDRLADVIQAIWQTWNG